MEEQYYALVAAFRPRPHGPGFGVPLFKRTVGDSSEMYIQVVEEGEIVAFVPTDSRFGEKTVRQVPKLAHQKVSVGGKEVFAFEEASGILLIALREEMIELLRQRIGGLKDSPFVLSEVAEFIGDKQLKAEAEAACNEIIEETRRNG